MNSKEQKIKDSYGEYWGLTNGNLNEDYSFDFIGSFNDYDMGIDFKIIFTGISIFRAIPFSIIGIENNNGWIKIESENDLPKDYDSLYDVCNNQNVDTIPMTLHQVKYLYDNKKITHYQKHNKKLPPLY